MKLCKAEPLEDGKSCPNKVDEGQEYCPYHLAYRNTKIKKGVISLAGVAVAGVLTFIANGFTNTKSE
ncbi:MAG: hypothetical protein ACI9EW_002293 [Cellvibrionaceae bacterium]|jgi:hypothetical protein